MLDLKWDQGEKDTKIRTSNGHKGGKTPKEGPPMFTKGGRRTQKTRPSMFTKRKRYRKLDLQCSQGEKDLKSRTSNVYKRGRTQTAGPPMFIREERHTKIDFQYSPEKKILKKCSQGDKKAGPPMCTKGEGH